MTITYPRTFPSDMVFHSTEFELKQQTSSGRTRGGGIITTQYADPYWQARFETVNVIPTKLIGHKAWADSLRGGMKTFMGYDKARPRPANYPNDAAVTSLTRAVVGGAFDGTFEITSIPTAFTMRSVNAVALRLPASFVFLAGDYMSISQGGYTTLHRIIESVTANANGNISSAVNADFTVEPAIKTTLFTAGAIATILSPLAEFVLDPDSVSGQAVNSGSPFVFSAKSKVA